MFSRKVKNVFKEYRKAISVFLLLGATQVTSVLAGDRHDGSRHIDRVQTFSGTVIYAKPYYPVPYVRYWQPVFGGHHHKHKGRYYGYGKHHSHGYPAWRDDHAHHGHKGSHGQRHHASQDQFYRPDKKNHRDHRGERHQGSRH